ncbi:MAG TPA: TfuA-like protein [Methanomassiliicoccales archaeon]|nr:TfuA-like protein [Methanomassiliicoccales archaeon]
MRTVVFLGPSLPIAEARTMIDAEIRPPVRRGDLPALGGDVAVIGIIDGVFMSEAAVGHREILSLLKRGVKIVGGGSMGALRAAELSDQGMVGIGRIFEMYSAGEIVGDDEVALTFNPETLEPLSEPFVNLRLNVQGAVKSGSLSPTIAEEVLAMLKRSYYPKRSIAALVAAVREIAGRDVSDGMKRYIDAHYEDYKRKDAIAVLSFLRGIQGEVPK